MVFLGLSAAERATLAEEVISDEARLRLTRLMRGQCQVRESDITLIHQNRFINMARTARSLPIYVLEADDMGMYENVVYGWHLGELELVMRRPNTAQLIELLADYIENGMLVSASINEILKEDGVGVQFRLGGFDENVTVDILELSEIEEDSEDDTEHPNIRLLISRMTDAYDRADYPGVLHASASIFETLAKVVFNKQSVENATLGSIIAGYRNRSALPSVLLDFVEETYNRRNTEPLAGHGATQAPSISAEDAAVLVELTKTCVRLERRLAKTDFDKSAVYVGTTVRQDRKKRG